MSHKTFRLISSLFLVLAVLGSGLHTQVARAAGPWYVTSTGDDNNGCLSPGTACATINGAIGKASSGDTIYVAVGTYTDTGTEVVLIDKDIILSGGWDTSFSTQSGSSIIDGEFTRRGVTVSTSVTAYMEYFVVQNGDLLDGKNGINNDGDLTLEKVTIQHNGTNPGSGGMSGIYNSAIGVLTLSNSAVINNGTDNSCFGGIWNEGSFTAINSTISGNISNTRFCYGAALIGYGTVSLNSTTIVNNIGTTDMMGAFGTFTLQNSLIGSCGNSTSMTSQGHNIISMNDCPIASTTGDQFGSAGVPIDLAIGPLQDNGGPTFTHALLPGSPAIEAGNPGGCTDKNGNPLTTDQRGIARPQGTNCDIGAFEFDGQIVPPANDNFVDAEAITSLPFSTTVIVAAAGIESGEPQKCSNFGRTAWYTFSPTETMSVHLDSTYNVNVYSASGPGFDNLSFQGCTYNSNGSFDFMAEAGQTYYLQADGIGPVQINLEQILRPANDNFTNAQAVTSLPFTATVDITNATNEPGEQQNCYSMDRTVWYSFTPTETMIVRANTQGSAVSGIASIYYASGPVISDLQFLTCSSPDGSPTFIVEANQTYYLQVGPAFGEVGNIQINLEQLPPVANDDFANAVIVDSLPFSDTRDTSTATSGSDDPIDCYNNGSVWYQFTPPNDTTITANTFGSDYDTTLAVYTGSRGALELVPGGCNDDFASLQSRVEFNATGGTTYYFMLGFCCGNGGTGGGNLVFSIEGTTPPSTEVTIDIKPGSRINPINPKSSGKIPVVILSTPDFNAPLEVDRASLTFGSTGNELSLVSCNKQGADVNRDGLRDLVCHFKTKLTGFKFGDTEGILKGQTLGGVPIEGRDVVRVLHASYP